MAYGSPNTLDEVGEYISQVRGGRQVRPEEVDRLKERYRRVGGKTPLLQITQNQASSLKRELASQGLPMPVYMGMKHWHPMIEETVERIVHDGASTIIGVALAPHYSRLSIGGYEDAVNRGLSRSGTKVALRMVKNWHTEKSLIQVLAARVNQGLSRMDRSEQTAVLFTAHSLPKTAVLTDDPYQDQLLETSRLVADLARVQYWEFAYQSAGEPKENWLGPQILEALRNLSEQGFHNILVCPVGFVSDHLEILYDLDIEAKDYGKMLGVQVERTASLNDDPGFISALASVVMSKVETQSPVLT